jgi:hypothetical protein
VAVLHESPDAATACQEQHGEEQARQRDQYLDHSDGAEPTPVPGNGGGGGGGGVAESGSTITAVP